MTIWRYDPSKLAVGDTVWLAQSSGWHGHSVDAWVVEKITPALQVIIKSGTAFNRITPRGNLVGEGSYGRTSVVSDERAAEIQADNALKLLWRRAQSVAENAAKAAHPNTQDLPGLDAAIADLVETRAKIAAQVQA